MPGVTALVQFGSYARGTRVTPTSDIDLFAVIRDSSFRSQVRSQIDRLNRAVQGQMSAVAVTPDEFESTVRRTPSFGAHLRDEGRVFGSERNRIEQILGRVHIDDETTAAEFSSLRSRAALLARENRLGGHYDTAIGRFFAVARAAAILHLTVVGEPVYDWRQAFVVLADRRPDLKHALMTIAEARQYYEALDGRADNPDPATREQYLAAGAAAQSLTADPPHIGQRT